MQEYKRPWITTVILIRKNNSEGIISNFTSFRRYILTKTTWQDSEINPDSYSHSVFDKYTLEMFVQQMMMGKQDMDRQKLKTTRFISFILHQKQFTVGQVP